MEKGDSFLFQKYFRTILYKREEKDPVPFSRQSLL